MNTNNHNASKTLDIQEDSPADVAAGVQNRNKKVERVYAADSILEEALPCDAKLVSETRPFPFYNYRDFSKQPDPDPLHPLTAPGRVPNFVAKMHAILSCPEFSDVITWLPHGRSWRVLKPREFEIRVIPTYFEHAKFSSFVRQANGWGFRRITQGRDRNSYYHELFLRGMPHLCKQMKRPGVAGKTTADVDHEPDFYKISQVYPVPEHSDEDYSIMFQCALQEGPKARMPIMANAYMHNSSLKGKLQNSNFIPSKTMEKMNAMSAFESKKDSFFPSKPASVDYQVLSGFPNSLGASENEVARTLTTMLGDSMATAAPMEEVPSMTKLSPLALTSNPAFTDHTFQQCLAASNPFAAGFAMAAALSQNQFQSMWIQHQAMAVGNNGSQGGTTMWGQPPWTITCNSAPSRDVCP